MAVPGPCLGVTGTVTPSVTPPVIRHACPGHTLMRLNRPPAGCDRTRASGVIRCRVRSQLRPTVFPLDLPARVLVADLLGLQFVRLAVRRLCNLSTVVTPSTIPGRGPMPLAEASRAGVTSRDVGCGDPSGSRAAFRSLPGPEAVLPAMTSHPIPAGGGSPGRAGTTWRRRASRGLTRHPTGWFHPTATTPHDITCRADVMLRSHGGGRRYGRSAGSSQACPDWCS